MHRKKQHKIEPKGHQRVDVRVGIEFGRHSGTLSGEGSVGVLSQQWVDRTTQEESRELSVGSQAWTPQGVQGLIWLGMCSPEGTQ